MTHINRWRVYGWQMVTRNGSIRRESPRTFKKSCQVFELPIRHVGNSGNVLTNRNEVRRGAGVPCLFLFSLAGPRAWRLRVSQSSTTTTHEFLNRNLNCRHLSCVSVGALFAPNRVLINSASTELGNCSKYSQRHALRYFGNSLLTLRILVRRPDWLEDPLWA